MNTQSQASTLSHDDARQQAPFSRVAPLLQAALLLGAGGGFALATVLTLTSMFSASIGPWWTAVAQAHGHLQLYGWAGLFVLGVAFHFLPRLRGAPLAAPRLVPFVLSAQVAGLLLRALSQPLLVITGTDIWRALLILSGLLECAALLTAVLMIAMTARSGPPLANRPAFRGILPFIGGAFCCLGIAAVLNLIDVIQAAGGGFVPATGDDLNVTLGLLGFLMPVALAMSARSLPMYAGLEALPQRVMWPIAMTYLAGLFLFCLGIGSSTLSAPLSNGLQGLGMVLLGGALIVFVGMFIRLMRSRGRLPERVSQLSPDPHSSAHSYRAKVSTERKTYGPYVALIASAYIWAIFGGLLLIGDGLTIPFGLAQPFSIDAIRHSFAIGFIALLMCGVAPRMIPGFSGGSIATPKLVTATLWLGNIAVILRVGSLLLAPLVDPWSSVGANLTELAFALSGPFGLALAICLLVNLWPAVTGRRSQSIGGWSGGNGG